MKKLSSLFMVAMLSVSFLACAKKEQKHQLRARSTDMTAYNSGGSSVWSNFMNSPVVRLGNPNGASLDAATRSYLSQNFTTPPSGNINEVDLVVQLHFASNGQILPQGTRMGVVVYDDYAYQYNDPFTSYYGVESGMQISGGGNGNNVDVAFTDHEGYSVRIVGTVVGGQFQGQILFNATSPLGSFYLPTQGVIF